MSSIPGEVQAFIIVACRFVGDYADADLARIHLASRKLTLLYFSNFQSSPLPSLSVRVKVNLRNQRVNFYQYGQEYESPALTWKSRYMHPSDSGFADQRSVDEELERRGIIANSRYGPLSSELMRELANHRLEFVEGRLSRTMSIPSLDSLCGKYFRFHDFIECGETQARTGLINAPRSPETFSALVDLSTFVLDPVIDYFGMVKLTYGFCSPELGRAIRGGIDPSRDQHASYEENTRGRRVCQRGGAAVDFVVEDESMLEVARWVVENTPFDRLYYYGDSRPIHVSYGRNHDGAIVVIRTTESGRRLPRVVTREAFMTFELG